ncbi:helix-turn-helix transcriptional regulator [Persicimonas caeni]|uniref:Helix-turn-helix transcriptional regulator n=1 Tax=Persicimonas caeni TaxID=2292766 RepID=A0A4Y6PXL3_PERCE|nr:helix-turn-helix transcriptional regulator [Persicimonas caeni]QDG53074.1 helix-turn-helix transcriptional regulator [Persicimonas caeni]QED34296.1 helix-turn-helix transcriptional regulator [Persicimonas caeni]
MSDDAVSANSKSAVSPETWRKIAFVWASLAAKPISKPDEVIEEFWQRVSDVLDFDTAFLVLAHHSELDRRAERLGYIEGWVPAEVFYAPDSYDPAHAAAIEEFRRERMPHDTWIQHNIAAAGEHRTFIRQDVLGDEPWESCSTGWLMEQMDVRDRMISVFALDDSVEVHLGFDRRGPTSFAPIDRNTVHALNKGLGPFWARLAMSFGLYKHQQSLTPRQRETLLYLLDGYSEAEIAELMNLTQGSAHQYVVAVFRSLNVNSRAELMAKWMGDYGIEVPEP